MIAILPAHIQDKLMKIPELENLIEVVLDLGRFPEARIPDKFFYLSEANVALDDIKYVVERIGKFGKDNRAGIERTLHRISAIRNRIGEIIGLTCRVGRAVYGTIDIIRDLAQLGKSILFLGRPGVGKTTMLREVARVLSDEFSKRVIVVDTSNEIAGDGNIPHPGIGNARRMQVIEPSLQHAVMIEAVENHMPEVIIVDEIGIEEEAYAARTIAERGVQLVATAHGNTLENLLMNPTLSDLVGGIYAVTLSDEEARKRGTQKTVLERKSPPTFDIVIEIQDQNTLVIHDDVVEVSDLILRDIPPQPEIRKRLPNGEVEILQDSNRDKLIINNQFSNLFPKKEEKTRPVAIFPYAVSRNRLAHSIENLKVSARIVKRWEEADLILTLKGFEKREAKKIKAFSERIPVYILKSNTITQVQKFLSEYFHLPALDVEELALKEAEEAAYKVLSGSPYIEISPQNSYIRRLQHKVIEKYNLKSKSLGDEPNRRLKIYKV
ncbi:MAG: AAA family ATPase [Armatimonadetes bacterium]|nr:AAA family ATPase [Armatimonadota bacterium]